LAVVVHHPHLRGVVDQPLAVRELARNAEPLLRSGGGGLRGRFDGHAMERSACAWKKSRSALPRRRSRARSTAFASLQRRATTKSSARTPARMRRYMLNFGRTNSSLYPSGEER